MGTPLRTPSKPEHHCSVCQNSSQLKLNAGTHFTKECPHLSPSDKYYMTRLFDKALQQRHLPQDQWAPGVTLRIMSIVEDYYDLPASQSQDSVLTINVSIDAKF